MSFIITQQRLYHRNSHLFRNSISVEWPDNDFRIFVGNLAKEVTTEMSVEPTEIYAPCCYSLLITLHHHNNYYNHTSSSS